ncbi:MAG: hypothetical protein BIFFINMI_02962 [Phycisphaerae bacterium]|nr:hypothetical protein [Phycisphaerae bacterium]
MADLKVRAHALYLAARDRRTGWLPRIILAAVAAYALCPLDLIPDFIPVLGLLDDLVLLPAGIGLAVRLIPREVWEQSLARAREAAESDRPRPWSATVLIVLVWLAAAGLVLWLVL